MYNSTLQQQEWQAVSDEHAEAALACHCVADHSGGFTYAAHDAFLSSLGYVYMKVPCSCGGSFVDGHEPHCGWGRKVAS
jgi:hypothetical protein